MVINLSQAKSLIWLEVWRTLEKYVRRSVMYEYLSQWSLKNDQWHHRPAESLNGSETFHPSPINLHVPHSMLDSWPPNLQDCLAGNHTQTPYLDKVNQKKAGKATGVNGTLGLDKQSLCPGSLPWSSFQVFGYGTDSAGKRRRWPRHWL